MNTRTMLSLLPLIIALGLISPALLASAAPPEEAPAGTQATVAAQATVAEKLAPFNAQARQSAAGQHIWTSTADFYPGAWSTTEILSDSVRLGRRWSPNIMTNDEPDGKDRCAPSLTMGSNGDIFAVWQDGRNDNWDIYFARSTDGGQSWSANVKINDDAGSASQEASSLAVDGSTIVVTWQDTRNSNYDIYFSRSTDGGQTWSANVKLNDDAGSAPQYVPSLAADGNGVVVAAWQDYRNGDTDIYYARSDDGGQTWGANGKLNDDAGGAEQYVPNLAANGNGVIIAAWQDTRNGEWDIYLTRSTDSGQTWGANARLNDDASGTEQGNPNLAADGSTIVAAWRDLRDGNADIYFARSTDSGQSWGANIKVNDDAGSAEQDNPSLAVDGSTVVAAWQDYRNGNWDVYLARSTNGGQTWGSNTRLGKDPGSAEQYAPSLAAGDGNVTAAWRDLRSGMNIYVARSTDGGQSWGANRRANDGVGSTPQSQPSLAVDGSGGLVAAWEDYRNGNGDIYFARSDDGGQTWSTNVKVSDATGGGTSGWPSLAADGSGGLVAAWEDARNGHYDIYFARSTDGGQTWSANVKVSDDTGSANQGAPSLAVDGSGVIVAAWHDMRNGNWDIYLARSTDNGLTWNDNVKVSNDTGSADQTWPSLAVDSNGGIVVVWEDTRSGNQDIYFARSTDNGQSWGDNIKVNDDANWAYQAQPSLAVDSSGAIVAAWHDNRNGNYDIYFARSTDNGQTWNANVKVSDDAGGAEQSNPNLAVDSSGAIVAAWHDTRNGNYDIYFARSTDGGQTWDANVKVNDDAGATSQEGPAIAAGNDGTLYTAWRDLRRDGNGDIYTSRWPGEQTYTSGEYHSPVLDAGELAAWNSLAWTATLPAGAAITLAVRVGNNPLPDLHWSAWLTATGSPANMAALPPARYAQWHAVLSSSVPTSTPSLNEVSLAWDGLAYTQIGGIISSDTAWTAAGSPYLATGNILVGEGVTLSVEPGVTVLISDSYSLRVQGTLLALGTSAHPITLTSWHAGGQPGDWGAIAFAGTTANAFFDVGGGYLGGSALRYVTLEYAGGEGFNYAMDAPNSAVYVDHCTIQHSGGGGLWVGGDGNYLTANIISHNAGTGIGNNGSSASIAHNTVSSNALYGIYNSGVSASIAHNTVSGNVSTGIYNSGSSASIAHNTVSNNAGTGIYGGGSSVNIAYNTVNNNKGGGVESSGRIENNVIVGNTGWYGGVYGQWGSIMRSNIITGNHATSYGGINWYGDGEIAYNTIQANTSDSGIGGIYLGSYSHPDIRYNTFQANSGYALYNNNDYGDGTQRVNARSNWWGSSDAGLIDGLIYDWYDDANKSFVDYLPFLDGPTPVLALDKSAAPAVNIGQPIVYTLTVHNLWSAAATGLVITDAIPAGAHYVSGGARTGNTVRWTLASLPGYSSASFSFVVTASQTLTNHDYHVTAGGGISATGQTSVTTLAATPLQSLNLTGPAECLVGIPCTFDAQAGPTGATQPVTYTWQPSGLDQVVHTAQFQDSAALTWGSPGLKTVRVMARNATAQVEATRRLTVYDSQDYPVYDAGDLVEWESLTWSFAPVTATLKLAARVGNSPQPDSHWSEWQVFDSSPVDLDGLPPSRYLQWQARYLADAPSSLTAQPAWTALAYTPVSGFIAVDTTWTAAESPYLLTGNVQLNQAATLRIEPGVTIWVGDGHALQLLGQFKALGTPARPITLTSWHVNPQPGDWGGIVFNEVANAASFDAQGHYLDGSALRYVTLEYAGSGAYDYALSAPGTAVYLDHCTLRLTQGGGAQMGGGRNAITANTIIANAGSGLVNAGSPVTITANFIASNTIGSNGGGLVNTGAAAWIAANTFSANAVSWGRGGGVSNQGTAAHIVGNTFNANSAYACGGLLNEGELAQLSDNTFNANVASGYGGGVCVQTARVSLSGNTFNANRANQQGGAVWWSNPGNIADPADPTRLADNKGQITYNTFSANSAADGSWGVYVARNYPTIRYNILEGVDGYAIYNANAWGAHHLDARYNWWGSADEDAIQAAIYDWSDGVQDKSIVDYNPYFLSQPGLKPDGVSVNGPAVGLVNTAQSFEASVYPNAVLPPLTYTWQVDGQPPLVYSGTVMQHAAVFTWTSEGTYGLTVTVSNPRGQAAVTHTITVVNSHHQDSYEADDACGQAVAITSDGAPQDHTFHSLADEDWIVFQATTGVTYAIHAVAPADSEADVALDIYDACGGARQDGQDLTFSSEVHLSFRASQNEPVYLRLYDRRAALGLQAGTYQLSVREILPTAPVGALVLVAGRRTLSDTLQNNINQTAQAVYRLFRQSGYGPNDIYFLASQQMDADGDGHANDVDQVAPTKLHLGNAIVQWAAGKVNPQRPFTLYMIDHGNNDLFYLYREGIQVETVSAFELDGWLDALEATSGVQMVNVVVEACRSGSFIDRPQSVSQPGRVVIASTGAYALAFASRNGAAFSDAFVATMGRGASLQTAFIESRWAMRQAHPSQTPWLDDNGNGIPNEPDDGQIAAQRGLTPPPALEDLQWPPNITQPGFAPASGEIAARVQVQSGKLVSEVIALIYPPSYQPPQSEEEMVQAVAPQVEMSDADGDGLYSGTYTFTEPGEYRVVIYAVDSLRLQARPQQAGLSGPALSIRKHGAAAAAPGELVTYTLTVSNAGTLAAADLVISDTIPAHAYYVGGGTHTGNTVEWTVANLAAGGEVDVTFSVTASQTIVNSAYGVRAADGTAARGTLVVATVINPARPVLHIGKSGPAEAEPGTPITYTLTVSNSGSAPAVNLVISDSLPVGAHYLSGGTRSGNTVEWTVASLAAGGKVDVTFSITASQTIINSAYGVRADGGVFALGQASVTTQVQGSKPSYRVYLPMIVKE